MIQAAFLLFVMGVAMTTWMTMNEHEATQDWTESAARHMAQVTEVAASRMFEMGSEFVINSDYSGGSPPGDAGSLNWLKNPNDCSITGIPPVPNNEAGDPVSHSFLPCDFDDQNVWGQSYSFSWDTSYPGTRMTIQVGSSPFTVNGARSDAIGGAIALKASSFSTRGLGDSTLDVIVNYEFDPATGTLTATVDRMSAFTADPYLRIDGSNSMDADASISWGNNMEIDPEDGEMHLRADDGIFLFSDTTVEGAFTVSGPSNDVTIDDGIVVMQDGLVEGTQVGGSYDALLSRAVYDYRIVKSGDVVDKPSCPSSSTAQIFLAPASVPVGDGMLVQLANGSSLAGDIKRYRAVATNQGSQWQVWTEVYMNGSWRRLAASDGDLRAALKCT